MYVLEDLCMVGKKHVPPVLTGNRYSGINMGVFNFLFYHLFEGISLKKTIRFCIVKTFK